MNLVLNELSFQPLNDNEHVLQENFVGLLKVFETGREERGFNHLVFPTNIRDIKVTTDKTFYEWIYGIAHQGTKNKILSVVKRPFMDEVLEEKVQELSAYYYSNTDVGIPETYCSGLALAHLKQLLCTSLSSQPFWDETIIYFFKIVNADFDTEQVSSNNISKVEHLADTHIKSFIEYLGELELIETDIKPENKAISLRDDHGKDKLLAFSKKLRNSKYVVSIINSLPFNPKAINLIKEIYSDGKIELVLYWEDKGIGIVVQTTGRNYRETEAIAKELKKEYDR